MSGAPHLLAAPRRWLAGTLTLLALGEALLAVLFASALDKLTETSAPGMTGPLLAAIFIAMTAALTLLLLRWLGEGFAQSFVTDCRAALFHAVTRHRGEGGEASWLTVLINDLAALRNYALRGTVRLWTSVTAGLAAALWAAVSMPMLRPGLWPLGVAALGIMLVALVLSRAIATQRAERGRLNRFLVRRVRGELSGTPSGPGRGFRRLAELSDSLARASVRRAALAGTMEAFAALGGLVAMLMILWPVFGGASGPGLAGNLMLTGFMAARLLESARALHARIGGGIALDRLEERLSAAAAPRAGRNRRRSPVARSAALRAGLPRPTQSLLSLTPPSASSSENTP